MNSGKPPGYDPRDFPPVAVTVDVVLFAIREGELNVLLVERGVAPFRGDWALPGGFVQPDDASLLCAASRELAEETGIGAAYLEQLATYGDVGRDPRMRVFSVAYWAACEKLPRPVGGSDANRAELVPTARIEGGEVELAFDHRRIVQDALDRLRSKLEYTALGARFCRPVFTISELREVYEVVWNTKLDAGNFQRKVRYNGAFREVEQDEIGDFDPGGEPAASTVLADIREIPRAPPALEAGKVHQRAVADSMADGVFASAMESRPAAAAGSGARFARRSSVRRQALTSPGRRGGRPASLWAAEDPAAMLNSPMARPAGTGGTVR